ncbi:MAG: clan AA aspartic protease [Verrucomicrobia bacterium]|nr:clan AA aspartic protease [Verrucomicrobiota bacterium]
MGRVIVQIKLANLGDLVVRNRRLSKNKPRQAKTDALVDTGATCLYLKPSVIRQLGLHRVGSTALQTTNGVCRRKIYEPVCLELMGRKGHFDVVEVAESVPNLLGQIPLEYLDFVVDARGQRLIPNPKHHGQWMAEAYCA